MRPLARTLFAGCLALGATSGFAAPASNTAFNKLADRYIDEVYYRVRPSDATIAGLHQFDTMLEPYDRSSITQVVSSLHAYDKEVTAFPERGLDLTTAGDRQIVLNSIHSTLLTLEVIRPWQKDPDHYASGITNAAYTLMEREFAPPDVRLRSLITREKQMPAALGAARQNLRDCAKISTEVALEQLPGDIDFFRKDVPSAFSGVTDAQLLAEFQQSNNAVIQALTDYEKWLRTDLLPRSNGDFRIGADTFKKKLQYDEMTSTPLDELLKIAYADLHKNQQEFARIAHEIDPTKSPREVLTLLGEDHPAPDHLLASFQARFDGLIGFIREHHIITIPSDVRPTLEETPPFMRATTQASMDTPGPFETHSTTAFFNVTLPDPSWNAERVADYMHAFNIGTIVSTSVHEAYPGHYVQFLIMPQVPSRVRKAINANSNVEGWAHYCEQMMLEEGYGQSGSGAKDERESKLIRLGQLQDALLRDARFVAGIRMHTQNLSIKDAVRFFTEEGYQSHEIAEVEVKRGTSDPTYLYYTLGKLEILKLRHDLEQKQGKSFSLQQFHDTFLQQGAPPIAIVRRAMLGDNSPVL